MPKATSKKKTLPKTFTLTLRKTSERALNPAKINQQLQKIKNRTLAGKRQARGWQCRVSYKEQAPTSPGLPYSYTASFTFSCNPRRSRKPEPIAREWDHIVNVATTAGNQPLWLPEQVEGKQVKKEDQRVARPDTLELAEYDIPEHWRDWFKEVYGRDEQIETIIDVLKEAKESAYTNRFNVILEGPPGSGKTEILRCLKKHLSADCWLEFDCTNTTAAGAIEELRSRAKMPTIIFLEEAEKATRPEDKSWLLAATDSRSEIRKVRYRNSVHREVHFVCICTVNNIEKLADEFEQALESRFPWQLNCPHPDEATLRKILEREIRARPTFKEEDLRWIDPTLKLAQELNETDPRKVKAWCLTGKDKLLEGGEPYQQRIKRTTRRKKC